MSKKRIIGIVGATAFSMLIVFSSCGTKKKSKEELSLLGRAYQNTTALYNGYFNANEIMVATYLEMEKSHQDNYTKLLKIFPYEYAKADDHKSQLDRAIQKVSVVATIHEPSHWRDDCYVLLCEAQFLLQEYEVAEESLRFTVHEFDPVNSTNKKKKSKRVKEKEKEKDKKEREKVREKKKKDRKKSRKRMTREQRAKEEAKKKAKEEEAKLKDIAEKEEAKRKEAKKNSDDGWLKHRPVFQDAALWMARAYIKRDKFSLANSWLRRLEEDASLHDEVREVLYAVRAQFYIEQGRLGKAEVPMEKAFINAPDRKTKARYAYILAQLKEKKGKYADAQVYYDKVVKLRPNFDMIFNAQLRNALNAKRAGKMGSESFAKEMDGMLKDDKYDDYQDQIYTALAEMSFESGDEEEGMAFLRKALSSGDKKSIYKTEAFYQIAEFFFNGNEYISAKSYYDSTLTVMATDDERHPRVKELSTNLTEIANQLQVIALQDSLIMLANLPKSELLKRAREMQEKDAEEEAANGIGGLESFIPTTAIKAPGIGIGKNNFFAYDPLLREKGFRDFKKNWGDRPLEDNWRRINKTSSIFNEEDIDEEEVAAQEEAKEGDELIEKYFSEVPFEKEDMKLAFKTKEGAMFLLGKLYRDKMNNCVSSTEVLENMLELFPNTDKEADALFYLYLCSLDQDDKSKADTYADVLVKNYPNTLYAKSISDPDYMKKEKEKLQKLDTYYEETYALFSKGEYDSVEKRLAEVDNVFASKGKLSAKYALLGAMMMGHTGGKEAYIDALRDVIAKHKETDEATRAREIMRFLQGDDNAFVVVTDGDIKNSKFRLEEDKLHYVFVVIFDLGRTKLNEAKISISSFNRRYHKKERLNLSTLDLDIENSTPVVLIRKFGNKDDAMDYYDDVMKRKSKFLSSKVQYEIYAISQRNYREVVKERGVNTYRAFFKQYYLSDDE